VVTGRQLIRRALRAPLQEAGWTPRAAGWFTRAIAPGYPGVEHMRDMAGRLRRWLDPAQ
jgi:hypothetical protein